ncbi:MAG: hypothetical protein QM692_08170 [Thermomicrobiales bacterium]
MHRRGLFAALSALVLAASPASSKRRKRKRKKPAPPCVPSYAAGPCTYDQCPLFVENRINAGIGAMKGTPWAHALTNTYTEQCCGGPVLMAPSRTYQGNARVCVEAGGF